MRINQFEFLLALKKYGSFSKAASKLYISQPSMSRSVKELEKELGFPLILRDRSGVTFTSMGEKALAEVQNIMTSIERLRAMADEELGGLRGEVHVACLSFLCSIILMEALAMLHHTSPKVQIYCSRSKRWELLDNIEAGGLDMGIIHVSSIDSTMVAEALKKRGLSFHPLLKDEGCFLMSSGHPLVKLGKFTLRQAAEHSLVLVRDDSGSGLIRQFTENGCRVPPIYIDDAEYTRFIQCSTALAPASVHAAQQLCSSCEGGIFWRTCDDFKWYSEIGWVQRNESPSVLQQLLIRNLELCSGNYQAFRSSG